MSAFTKFLNLFKWQPDIDGDEEFDIEKSLNENWDKIDTKLETYMTDLSKDVEDFKNNTDTQVEDIANQVSGLREISISPTQPTSNESVWIKKGKNLFNGILTKGGINSNNGTNNDGLNAIRSDYIKVNNNISYTLSSVDNYNNYIIFYNENYEYIDCYAEGKSINTFVTPANCSYIRFTTYSSLNVTDTTSKFQLEQNSTATTYEAYIDKEIYVKNENGVFERFYKEENIKDNQYHTEEHKIGTWINGKPIYRKIFTTTITASSQDINTGISGFETLVDLRGYLVTDLHIIPLGFTNSEGVYVSAFTTGSAIKYRGFYDAGTLRTIIEYTKTTD